MLKIDDDPARPCVACGGPGVWGVHRAHHWIEWRCQEHVPPPPDDGHGPLERELVAKVEALGRLVQAQERALAHVRVGLEVPQAAWEEVDRLREAAGRGWPGGED